LLCSCAGFFGCCPINRFFRLFFSFFVFNREILNSLKRQRPKEAIDWTLHAYTLLTGLDRTGRICATSLGCTAGLRLLLLGLVVLEIRSLDNWS
jgi:hypothetical protein